MVSSPEEISFRNKWITKEELLDWQSHHTDKYFSAEEAISKKIADKII